jgi:hypothetical protein
MASLHKKYFDAIMSGSPMIMDLSWKEVLRIDVRGKTDREIKMAAQSKGLSSYIWNDQVRTIEGDEIVGEICYLRVYLDVPYADKEAAKLAGARWDSNRRLWYGTGRGSNLEELSKWTSCEDRILLRCASEHAPFALARGALRDNNGTLFVPSWYWLARLEEEVNSLCYWLPPEHEAYRTFKNVQEAAEQISLCGYIRDLAAKTLDGTMPTARPESCRCFREVPAG